jgi:AraC family transcriptional regulator
MNWLKNMNNALRYIDDHLFDELTLEEIASKAYCSKTHFSRVFGFLADMSVFEYIRNRRLSIAAMRLENTEEKIIDVALTLGYETPEAFSKAFKKYHGISPSKVKTFKGDLKHQLPLTFSVVVKGEVPMNYRIETVDSFKVVGVKRRISKVGGENFNTIPAFWQDIMKDGTYEKIASDVGSLGVIGITSNCSEQESAFDYYIARQGEEIDNLDYDVLEIPKSKYAIFTATGPLPGAIQEVWKAIFSEFFPSSEFEHAGTEELEVYLKGDPDSPDYKSEVWIPIK